jgi:hypothetical protein
MKRRNDIEITKKKRDRDEGRSEGTERIGER